MGAGITEACARAGSSVVGVEADPDGAGRCQARIEASLRRAVLADPLVAEEAESALARIDVGTGLEAAATADLVIEAVPEVESLKLDLFRHLDAILASNTSIPLVKLASVSSRPERFVGVHNPAPVLPLVEIVASQPTSKETLLSVTDFAEKRWGSRRSVPRTGPGSLSTRA